MPRLADLEAGPTTPFERYHAFASDVMVVVGPAWRSAMTARRLLTMVADVTVRIVANQWHDEPDHAGLTPWARIPFDPDVREVERRGAAPRSGRSMTSSSGCCPRRRSKERTRMKIVVTGKGGSGKSTVAGTLIRHLARRGHRVVALDADPNPNLGVSIGLARDGVESMVPILNALLKSGFTHNDPQPPAEDLLRRYGVQTIDGIVLIATGRIERPAKGCLCCGSHNVTRQFFGELRGEDRVVVADLEAGLNDLIWAHPEAEDVVVAVSDGSAKSVEIARRARGLAKEMGVVRGVAVANRGSDAESLAEQLSVPEVVAVPEDPSVLAADQLGVAPFGSDPNSAAVLAVGRLATCLVPHP